MEIAAIGNEDFVIGFRLAGVKRVLACSTPEQVSRAVSGCLSDRDVGIVVMLQRDVDTLPALLCQSVDESIEPTFIAIGGEAGAGMREKIKRAIGVDLWKEG